MPRWLLHFVRVMVPLVVLLLASAASADATSSVRAVRGTPTIDGRLDDPAWRRAVRTRPFLQRAPEPGAPGTHRTTARVLFDDEALYVGMEMQTDSRPVARIGRRDQIPEGETASVAIDSRGEGNSAFVFRTNPAGVQADAINQGDGEEDSWDAVWEVETSISDRGWTVEFRIPWRILRFDAARPNLRVQIDREDFTRGEVVAVVPIEADALREVSRYARLTGLSRVSPRRLFELRPFVLGRWRAVINPAEQDSTSMLSGSGGADLKLGLTNDIVLDVTALPDFGQVEVDPTRVNLSTFELFFPERRPFFLEGSDLFATPIQLVYTRRIGAVAEAGELGERNLLESVPRAAMIFGAARVTGRVGRVSFGIIEAVTDAVQATVARTDTLDRLQRVAAPVSISPMTSWLIGRARAGVGPGSFIGGLFTHVGRIGESNDFAAGLDWAWRAPDGVHHVRGQIAATRSYRQQRPSSQCVGSRTDANEGTGAVVEAERAESRTFNWAGRLSYYSCGFDPNGLGFLQRPDLMSAEIFFRLRSPRPVGPFRSVTLEGLSGSGMNSGGMLVSQFNELDFTLEGANRWSTVIGLRAQPSTLDDRETRGGIPYRWNPTIGAFAQINSDRRSPLFATATAEMRSYGIASTADLRLRLNWTPIPALGFSSEANLQLLNGVPRFVGRAGPDGPPVFGDNRGQVFDVSLRARLAISRSVTFDLFSQFLYSNLRYTNFRELLTPTTFGPSDRSIPADGGDDVRFTVNAVARFEYVPGSFFTIVLLHRAGTGQLADQGFFFGRPTDLIVGAQPDTTLMAKLTYLLY